MRYYTFEWARGEIEGDPGEDYSRFLRSLDHSSSVYRFGTTVSLHDAFLDRVVFDKIKKELRLLLLSGDLQVGYWRTELHYTGATLQGEAVLADALDRRPTEVSHDEFSPTDTDGRLSHHFLLVPKNMRKATAEEFSIEFASFSYTQEAASDRTLATSHNVSVWC